MATQDQRHRIRQIFTAKGGQLSTRDLVLAVLHRADMEKHISRPSGEEASRVAYPTAAPC